MADSIPEVPSQEQEAVAAPVEKAEIAQASGKY